VIRVVSTRTKSDYEMPEKMIMKDDLCVEGISQWMAKAMNFDKVGKT